MCIFFYPFSLVSIKELTAELSVDTRKLIPVENLSSQSAILWSYLVQYMRETDDMEEYLDEIIPELTYFCTYLKEYVNFFLIKLLICII